MALRVGFDTTPLLLNRAGEARYAGRLLEAMAPRTDVELVPLSPPRRRPGSLAQRIALQGAVQAVYYPAVQPWQARRARVDLVHLPRHLVPPQPGVRVPEVVTIHDVLPLRAPELFSAVIRANFRLLTPALARRATRVITGSAYTRGEIVELLGVAPDRVVVTPYGVDARFRPAPPEPAALRERFGIDRPYVLCVGTLEPRKNLATALRAFARVADHVEDLALVVVGGAGWGNAAFDEALRGVRADVVLPGYVGDEDLVGLLAGARCFLYPSLFEGFGFPPLEAMACGAPVVTSDRASIPEVVGDAALTADPEDVDALADAVARVVLDDALHARLRRRGLERSSLYTWERCAAATVDVYRDALAHRAA
jgi:glycosyltransferase involved in cell wall biosynthesis